MYAPSMASATRREVMSWPHNEDRAIPEGEPLTNVRTEDATDAEIRSGPPAGGVAAAPVLASFLSWSTLRGLTVLLPLPSFTVLLPFYVPSKFPC
ncbi:hypothetical protein Aduo_012759 [Ancylostoma duodenale]